jgi:hypothetical protein
MFGGSRVGDHNEGLGAKAQLEHRAVLCNKEMDNRIMMRG